MKAMGFTQHGDASVIQPLVLPEPMPGPGQVVVDVKAVALNHLDVWVRRGWPGLRLEMPHVLGSDLAGVVARVGAGVDQVQVGDAVVVAPGVCCGACKHCLAGEDSLCARYAIMGELVRGGCSEQFLTHATQLLPKPQRLSFAQAASFPLTFQTAWRMLMVRAQLRAGETLLITGASAGVAVAAIQLGKWCGATVVAITRGDTKMAAAQALGAHHVVDALGDVRKQVQALVGKDGVDVVFEHVGGKTFGTALGLLRKGGRLVTCGATSGAVVEVDLRHVFIKQQAVLGSTMGSRADLLRVCGLFDQGHLQTVVDTVLPMSQLAKAHTLLEEQHHFGKVVVEP